MTPQTPAGLGEIAERYDVILCDIWGVVHNGREAFAEACAALARFRNERGPVILISNAPRPHQPVIDMLDGLAVPRDAWSQVVTSGDACRVLLATRAPGPVWKLGPERDAPLYEGLDLSVATGPDDAAFICCTGPYDDEVDTPEDYRVMLTKAQGRGLEMICANPDLVVQRGDKLIYCAGALAALYAELGGRVAMAGKPHPAIYDLALSAIGGEADRARVLCIGDGLPTDIAGANAQGLDALFVASGIHGTETIVNGRLDPLATARLLGDAGLDSRWAMADLVW